MKFFFFFFLRSSADRKIFLLVVQASGGLPVLLERAHEVLLLLDGLEPTVTNLRSSIDKVDLDLLKILPLVVDQERLPQDDGPLPDTHAGAFDDDKVVLDLTVMGEVADGVDGLDGQVGLGGTVVLVGDTVLGLVAGADPVDLLVDLDPVVVTLLTTSGNGVGNPSRMPSTDTSDLPETPMGLPRELLGAPPGSHTLPTVTLGDTAAVQVLVHSEDVLDGDVLLEETDSEVDLLGDVTTVDLELDDVSLLLLKGEQLHLGVGDEPDHGAVLLDLGDVGVLSRLSVLGGGVVLPLVVVLGESLLFRRVEVLVVPPLGLLADVVGPDGLEGPQATGGLDVADDAHADHGGSLDDGDGLDDFLLVHLGAVSVDDPRDVGHTGLVADKPGEVTFLGLVVLGVGLDAAEMTAGPLPGEEPFGTVSGGFEFPVRHFWTLSVSST